MHIHTEACTSKYGHIRMHLCTHKYINTKIHKGIHTCAHASMRTCRNSHHRHRAATSPVWSQHLVLQRTCTQVQPRSSQCSVSLCERACGVCGLLITTWGAPGLLFRGMNDPGGSIGGLQPSLLNFPSVPLIIDLPNERILFSAGSHYFSQSCTPK